MRIVLCLTVFLALCLAQAKDGLCADTLTNIRQQAAPSAQGRSSLLVPGTMVRLPDGRQTRIIEVHPEGIRTELGVTLTPEGMVQGSKETAPVTVVEPAAIVTPEKTSPTPEGTPSTPETLQTPAIETPELQNGEAAEATVPKTPESTTPQQTVPATPEETPHQLTIVELLPLTPTPEQPKAEKAPVRKDPEQTPPSTAEEKKTPPAKEVTPKEAKAKKEKAKEQKPKQDPPQKPAVGEELRIPPEAVTTGNLDFLEGCWQGTRPEYYSKRIIKECFCFGTNGGAGKRRVIDSQGGRMCIGSSKAKLSKKGELSVTSSGAACTDGERWGQAEMVCTGTGQRAPCTWVFKDAQGGRQSYEIPFVRVESCGR